jgi:hypothetical protein
MMPMILTVKSVNHNFLLPSTEYCLHRVIRSNKPLSKLNHTHKMINKFVTAQVLDE